MFTRMLVTSLQPLKLGQRPDLRLGGFRSGIESNLYHSILEGKHLAWLITRAHPIPGIEDDLFLIIIILYSKLFSN